jgi:ubiquitin conjugation factor E4 B
MDSYLPQLDLLTKLLSMKPLREQIASLESWLPQNETLDKHTGVSLENTFLGTFFRLQPQEPDFHDGVIDLVDACGRWSHSNQPTDSEHHAFGSVVAGLRKGLDTLHVKLLEICKCLLKSKSTKERLLQWIGLVVDRNFIRTTEGYQNNMRSGPPVASSDGMLSNLAVVLLRLCEPFLDPTDPKMVWKKVDMSYMLDPPRFNAVEDTRIALSREEYDAVRPLKPGEGGSSGAQTRDDSWTDVRNTSRIEQFQATAAVGSVSRSASAPAAGAGGGSSSGEGEAVQRLQATAIFGTVSEYNFLCQRCLTVGTISAIGVADRLSKQIKNIQKELPGWEEKLAELPAGSMQHRQLSAHLVRTKLTMRRLCVRKLALDTTLLAPSFSLLACQFYRLQSVVLLRLAAGGDEGIAKLHRPPDDSFDSSPAKAARAAAGTAVLSPQKEGAPYSGGLPLPQPAPLEFAALPENCLDSIAEFIKFVQERQRRRRFIFELGGPALHDLLTFVTAFLVSKVYVRNPYFRAKLVKMLAYMLQV